MVQTATIYPVSSSDDGRWASTGFDASNSDLIIGYLGFGGNWTSFFRLPSCPVPNGSTLISAIPKVTCKSGTSSSTFSFSISFVDADNPLSPTSLSEAGLLQTTSAVTWSDSSAWSTGVRYTLPDVKSSLQEVISRSGYSHGNSIILVISNNGSVLDKRISSIRSSTSERLTLDLTWAEPSNDGGVSISSLSLYASAGAIANDSMSSIACSSFSGSIGIMSFPPMSSNQTSGVCGIAPLSAEATGLEIITTYAQGSMAFDIDNDGLGGMSVGGFTAGLASQSIPGMTVSGTAKPGNDGVMSFAAGSATGRTGANGGFVLSVPSSTGTTINSARGTCAFQALTLYGFVYTGTLAHGVCAFKKLSCSSLGLNGRIGLGAMGVKIRMLGTALAGKLMSGESTMQPATAAGQASVVSKGTSALTFFPLDMAGVATADASEFSSSKVYDEEAMQ